MKTDEPGIDLGADADLRRAVIDGHLLGLDDARVRVTDDGFARGDGAFETVGVWSGRPFRLDAHLERLAASLRAVKLAEPDRDALAGDVERVLAGVRTDAALRIYVTASGTRIVTLDHPPARPQTIHLVPQPAPWIRPLGSYSPAGAKTMSYLPNMVATRAAQEAGGDDALLMSLEGLVLEGPTFAVYWARDGILYAPTADLGIVDSISRRTVLSAARDAGRDVVEGAFGLGDVEAADEVMLSSAVRDVVTVRRVGDKTFDGSTPVRDRLSAALWKARRRGAGQASTEESLA